MTNCKGVMNENEICDFECLDGEEYRERHIHQKDYTDDIKKHLVRCQRCPILVSPTGPKRCLYCASRDKKSRQCAKNNKPKCYGVSITGDRCSYDLISGTYFCGSHKCFLGYSEDQLNNLTICSGCSNGFRYIIRGNNTCINCHARRNKTKITGKPLDKPPVIDYNKYIDMYKRLVKKEIDKKENNKCVGLCWDKETKKTKLCNENCLGDAIYCEKHLYQKNYTNETKQHLTKCRRCISMIPIGNIKTCEYCLKRDNETHQKEAMLHKCYGVMKSGERCINSVSVGKYFCNDHSCLEHYTEIELNEMKPCSGCNGSFRYLGNYETCVKCRNRKKNNIQINKVTLQEPPLIDYDRYVNIVKNSVQKTDERCHGFLWNNGKDMTVKCNNYCIENEKYCNEHMHLKKYSENEMKQLRACSGCKQWKILSDKYKSCNECLEKAKILNAERKEITDKIPRCKTIGCTNKQFDENGYCMVHIEDARIHNLNITSMLCRGNVLYNCSNQVLSNDKYLYCDTCKKEIGILNIKHYDKESNETFECFKCKRTFKKSYAIVTRSGSLSKTCEYCFCRQTIREARRFLREHNWREEYIRLRNNPVDFAKKQLCKNEYPKRVSVYIQLLRNKLVEKFGVDEFQHLMELQIQKFNKENLIEMIECCGFSEKNISDKFKYYVKGAKDRHKLFNLTQKQCEKLFKEQCYYCGFKYENDGYLLGIDRKNNNLGYLESNCVSCCSLCNYMKRTYTENDFINICEHILVYCGIIDGNLYPNIFENAKNISYKQYYENATRRNYSFDLSKEEFNIITTKECYMCGKRVSHGIDRINNDMGYCIENAKSCCKTCNFLKSDNDLKSILIHLIKIVNHKYKLYEIDEIKNDYNNCNDIEANIIFDEADNSNGCDDNFDDDNSDHNDVSSILFNLMKPYDEFLSDD